jgi:hypothetical protein
VSAEPEQSTRLSPEVAGVSIVLLGRFNPAIFQPQWFAKYGLIPSLEADNAEIQIVHPNATVFSTSWLGLEVTPNRFAAGSHDPTMAHSVRDLVLSTFALLEHTPLAAMGLNRHLHFPGNPEWLAQFQARYIPGSEWASVLKDPVWKSTVALGTVEGRSSARLQIKLQPSNQVAFGVYLDFNEHFVIDNEEVNRSQEEKFQAFASILETQWSGFIDYCDTASATLLRSNLDGSSN